MSTHTCPDCDRAFLYPETLADHAEAVHAFGDLRDLVTKALRGRITATDAYGTVRHPWTYVVEMSADWVVFEVEGVSTPGSESTKLWKADYSVSEGNVVTISEPFEVVRRTVFEPVTV